MAFLAASAAVTASLFALEKLNEKVHMWQYAAGAVGLWYCLLRAGVNADIAGVIAALAVPASALAPKGSHCHPLEEGMKPTLMDHLIHQESIHQ
eukprot:5394679-Pyramimonas_sp.AAC.1